MLEMNVEPDFASINIHPLALGIRTVYEAVVNIFIIYIQTYSKMHHACIQTDHVLVNIKITLKKIKRKASTKKLESR